MYLNGTSAPPSTFAWERNVFRALEFAYTPADPGATDRDVVAGRNPNFTAPIAFRDNQWAGTTRLIAGLTGGDGTTEGVTATGNLAEDPGAIELRDGPWSSAGRHLTAWTPTATVVTGSPPVTFRAGDRVTHGAAPTLYRCTADATGTAPPDAPAAWTAVPRPTDDVRVVAGSRYAELGVR